MTASITKVVELAIPQGLSLVAIDNDDTVCGVLISEDYASGVSDEFGKNVSN